MKIIRPTDISGSIISNNIAGSDLDEWNVGTAYTAGQLVQVAASYSEYLCNVSNTGEDPTAQTVDGNGDLYWVRVGSTNDRALIDGRSRKASKNPLNITFSFRPTGFNNGLALLNINTGTLNVTCVSDSAGEVYNVDFTVREYVNTFYDYFFSPIENISNIVRIDLPNYNDMVVTVTAVVPSGDVSIGELIVGRVEILGTTQYGTSLGLRDFSTKEDDFFGNPTIIERTYRDTITYDVWVEAQRTGYVKRRLAEFRAKPLVYIGNEDLSYTITYGFFKSINPILEGFETTSMSLEVEELS